MKYAAPRSELYMKRLGAGRTLGRGRMKARSEIDKDSFGRGESWLEE